MIRSNRERDTGRDFRAWVQGVGCEGGRKLPGRNEKVVVRVSGFGFSVSCSVFRVSCFGFRVSCFEFRVSCFGFRVS